MSASSWFYCKKFITMHGHMNVKFSYSHIFENETYVQLGCLLMLCDKYSYVIR
jgi:hypothetical protein